MSGSEIDEADIQEIVVGEAPSDDVSIASASDIAQKIRVVGMYPGETKMTVRDESGQVKEVIVVVKDKVIQLVAPSQARPSAAIKSRLSFPYLQSRHLRESSSNTLDSVYVL